MMAVRHFDKIALVVESRVSQGDFDFLAHVLNAVVLKLTIRIS